MGSHILALDQGTTSSRAIVFDKTGEIISIAQHKLPQIFPAPGLVEHDPMEILDTQLRAMAEAFAKSKLKPADIAGVGVTNQRETTIIWERETGRPVHNAIVWQCRRTAEICDELKAAGHEKMIHEKTGLVVDAYFSGTKIKWLLDNIPGLRSRAEAGELLFGTVDTWLIWNLTGGKSYVTDYSNASRTMLFDINRLEWDAELCALLGVPMKLLPGLVESAGDFGRVAEGIHGIEALAGIPICGIAGDQAAALLGQGCIRPGMAKNTYGTGCFMLANTGERSVRSSAGLLTSVAWSIGGAPCYALEGSVFNAGSLIQWLRDELRLISTTGECDVLAETVPDNGGAYISPAFTGLGSPYWDSSARGAIFGLTRGVTRAHIARAVLESIAYQVTDLADIMASDMGMPLSSLRVDGGASVSEFMMQFQAELLRFPIDRPKMVETTAFGAAFLAGLSAGVWGGLDEIESLRKSDREFSHQLPDGEARALYATWKKAVSRSLGWVE